MLPVARSDNVEVQERDGTLIVGVPELGDRHVLPALAGWVWRHADGMTSTGEMVRRVESELLVQTDEETIRCVLDSLADAHLLVERTLPPAAARRDLMWRERLQAGLTPDTVGKSTFLACSTVSRVQAVGGGEDRQKEEARKQEEGDKQRQREFQEKDAKRQDEWKRQEQENKRNEQEGKRRV